VSDPITTQYSESRSHDASAQVSGSPQAYSKPADECPSDIPVIQIRR
jgi:hypothetical protein